MPREQEPLEARQASIRSCESSRARQLINATPVTVAVLVSRMNSANLSRMPRRVMRGKLLCVACQGEPESETGLSADVAQIRERERDLLAQPPPVSARRKCVAVMRLRVFRQLERFVSCMDAVTPSSSALDCVPRSHWRCWVSRTALSVASRTWRWLYGSPRLQASVPIQVRSHAQFTAIRNWFDGGIFPAACLAVVLVHRLRKHVVLVVAEAVRMDDRELPPYAAH